MTTLKQELMVWGEALEAYDAENYQLALAKFSLIAETSRIFFNIGLIHATLGEHDLAIPNFQSACEKDTFLAVAFFQLGVSQFLLGQFDDAVRSFDETLATLRGNMTIDYEQIGLKFRLYSCEVLFNKGLCLMYMGRGSEGMSFLDEAARVKQTAEHSVIDEGRRDKGEGYNVFSIPAGVLYRPPASKLRNLQTRNYLGQARLVAATDSKDAFTTFSGITKARMRQEEEQPPPPQQQRKGPVSTGLDPLPETKPLERSMTRANTATAKPRPSGPTPLGGSAAGELRRRPSDYSAAVTASKPPPVPPVPKEKPAPFQPAPLSRKPSQGGAPPTLPKLNMGGPQPLDTPPGSDSQDQGYEDQQDVLNAYADARESRPVVEELMFEQEDRNPMGQSSARIAEWASKTAAAAPPNAPLPSPGSAYPTTPGGRASTAVGRNQSLLRSNTTITLRPPMPTRPLELRKAAASTPASVSEQSSELFGAGDASVASSRGVERIRIKLHCESTIRGMIISPELPLEDMMDLVCRKLSRDSVKMQFVDGDGTRIEIMDEGDWDAALDTARETANGRPDAKLAIHAS